LRTKEIPLAAQADDRQVQRAIEAAVSDAGLTVTLRGSLRSFPGCVHWHLKRGRESGTLEVTLWPRERRAWFAVQDGRRGEWIEETMSNLSEAIQRRIGQPTMTAMTAKQILDELRPLGSESYKKTLKNHGIQEPLFGVKIEELKKIQKRIKHDYQLALDLYDTGNYDAMYLAGLIADDAKMTKKDLRRWLSKSSSQALCEYTVPWVAAGSPHGWELALEWIESKEEPEASAGWGTLSSLVATKEDADLDLPELKRLLQRVQKTIHQQPNCVRYAMNGFVIAVGSYVSSLTDLAIEVGEKIGEVTVDMGATACKVPSAPEYIRKVQKRGTVGKKRKSAKC
jgi:3-methyladenine DNA glycosylase AlkD